MVGLVTPLALISLTLDGCYFCFHDARMIPDLPLKTTSEEPGLLDFYTNATGLHNTLRIPKAFKKIILQNQVQCLLANGISELHVAMTVF
jgi:hypothetical protein